MEDFSIWPMLLLIAVVLVAATAVPLLGP